MNKNMTRKGLALGAAAALAVSGLVGSPAYAATTLTIAPSAGSGYTTLAGSTFSLEVGIPSTMPADSHPFLKYRITNPTLQQITTNLEGYSSTGTEITKAYGTATDADGDGTGVNVTDDDFVAQAQDQSTGSTNTSVKGKTNVLKLTQADHTYATSVGVTAWLDTNNNNTIDAGEDFSPTETVTFVKASLQTASVAIVAPLVGAASLNANVTFSNADINVRQIDAGDVLVQFGTVSSGSFTAINSFADAASGVGTTTNATTVTTRTSVKANNEGNSVEWDSVDSVYEAEFTPSSTTNTTTVAPFTAVAATVYGAKLFLDQGDNEIAAGALATSDQEGNTSTTTTGASASGYNVKWDVTGSANAITTAVGYEAPTNVPVGYSDDVAMTASVRATATAASDFTFKVFVGTAVTTTVGIKSVPVSVTVSSTNLTLADAVTANGLSVYNGKSRAISLTTDSSGMVSIAVVGGKADATDELDFLISVNGTEPGASNNNSKNGKVTFAAADYDIHAKNDLSGNGGISIVSGQTFTVDYEVLDQFGQAPANGAYRVVAVDKASTNAERTTAADFAISAPIVDGTASLVITDDGVGTGSYTLQAGWATTDAAISASNNDSVDLTVKVGTDVTASTVVMDALVYGSAQLNDANADGDYSDAGDTDKRTGLTLETETFSQYVVNTALPSASAPDVTSNIGVTLAGTVKNAAGVAVPYASVTITAPKFMMVTNSNYVLDAITLYADSLGKFSVVVYSQSGGVNNLVVTSGAASATTQLTYAGAVSGAAASFTITTPGASEPGRTVDVAVKVVDKNGNGVQAASVTLSSTGPGYLINTTGTTLSDGTFVTKLLLGANDSGTAVIKAVMTIDAVQVIKTSSIVVGVGAVASSDQKVNAGSFKGYVALYALGYEGQRMSAKVGNDWVIVPVIPAATNGLFRAVEFVGAGVDISVRIYIDRVLLATIPLLTQ
jgi:hypothetical protein